MYIWNQREENKTIKTELLASKNTDGQYKEPENSGALLYFLVQQDHPRILLPVPSAAVKIK
jgi:hypothetical protein